MKKKIPFMESFFIKRHIRPRKYKTKEKLSMNPLRYPGAKSKLFKYIKTYYTDCNKQYWFYK